MAVEWPIEPEDLDELFRFALFLGEDRSEAAQVVREVVRGLETKPEASEPERARRFCFWEIRKRMLKSHPHRTGSLLKSNDTALTEAEVVSLPMALLQSTLRTFPEPVRSAAVLFFTTDLPVEDIGRVLDLSQKELAVEMGIVRQNLLSLGVAIG